MFCLYFYWSKFTFSNVFSIQQWKHIQSRAGPDFSTTAYVVAFSSVFKMSVPTLNWMFSIIGLKMHCWIRALYIISMLLWQGLEEIFYDKLLSTKHGLCYLNSFWTHSYNWQSQKIVDPPDFLASFASIAEGILSSATLTSNIILSDFEICKNE